MNIFSIWVLLIAGSLCAADIYDANQARSLLGYDPCITLLKETDPTVVRSTRKTIYFHGFGGNKDAASAVKRYYGSGRLPGDVITFDFSDANNGGMNTSKSSLGQWNDIKTALYVVKKVYDAGETAVGITAHSRGGATAVNMVAVLADKTGQYDANLSALGIDSSLRVALLGMLQKGNIVLECPLIDVRSVIQHQIKESTIGSSNSWLGWLFGWSLSPSTYSSAASVDYVAPFVLKEYRPWAEQAITSAAIWNGVQIPTMVHFQEQDEVLGTARNNDFFEKLKAANGEHCTYLHQGNDGGHNSSFKSFAVIRNRFLRQHGASYMGGY